MFGIIIRYEGIEDTTLPYEVRLDNGSEGWFGESDLKPINSDIGPDNKEEIQDEVGAERVDFVNNEHSHSKKQVKGYILRSELTKELHKIIDGAIAKHKVKSVTINSTGITVEFHK